MSWEEVWTAFTDRNRRLEFLIFQEIEKMTPIERIAFISLYDLQSYFGIHHFNLQWQQKIGKYTVDFVIIYHPIHDPSPQKKIVVECDGHDFHEKTKEQAAKDKQRDRFLAKEGYMVLRYSGSEIVRDRRKIFNDIEEIILPEQQRELYGYGLENAKH